MAYVFPPRDVVAVPIAGTDALFPINRIFCVGRNYAAHAREMGKDPDREPPFFFMKDAGAYAPDGAVLPFPPATRDFQHEIELVVAIGGRGRDVPADSALRLILGYAVGLDMTRRDLQMAAREAGRPWDTGKNMPLSAPCSAIRPAAGSAMASAGAITLSVNGACRQQADLADMIWTVPEIIEHLSRLYTLEAGDLIFTGTPAGVGPVHPGDVLEGSIADVGRLTVTIGAEAEEA